MTARLSAQINALTLESSKLNAVLQEMTDGVVIVDRDGLIQLINPAAEKMFTAQVDKTLGRSLAEILRHYQIVELWQKCLETGETQVVTLDLGIARLYLQGIATPLGAAMPGSTLLLFQDLTKLRHLETVRRDFISNISHELRTPLASLKALTETLQDSIVHDPDASPKFLERMETEVDSLSLMVAELVELSRIESGKVPLHFAATQPRAILESAYQRLHLQAERADLVITLDCPPDLPLVLVDQERIEQVVMNLLHNAIKFTPAGGSISLSASLGQAGTDQAMVVFSIRDSGVGIHPDDLPRIFERFYKADRARSGGGTGLGLAIARHLVEAHAGKIWAESVLDQGSTFYFSVPVYTSV
jgi:two-component system phosphate regulon sensor histidine kinase PhoR